MPTFFLPVFLSLSVALLGIKVIIDKDNDGSVSLVRFMEDGVANNRYVICVCSDGYLEKEIPGHRRGIHVELDDCASFINLKILK